MAVRKFKPVTPGQRNKVISAFDDITCTTPEKSLLRPLKRTGGRNNQGKMTMRYLGGGHKRMYRVIDFHRDKINIQPPLRLSSTIPTAVHALHWSYMVMAKNAISFPNGIKVGQVIASVPVWP